MTCGYAKGVCAKGVDGINTARPAQQDRNRANAVPDNGSVHSGTVSGLCVQDHLIAPLIFGVSIMPLSTPHMVAMVR
jgi:hypothetical protein